jgi:hypothetical protein
LGEDLDGITQYSTNTNNADHGKLAVLTEQGVIKAWNLLDGTELWTSSPAMEYPWDEPGFGAYSLMSAYGKLIRPAYSGIYAYNWDDGSCTDIATVLTSGYYGTFSYVWTPETEGTYEIIAAFVGEASYGSSAASTSVAVGQAAAAGGAIEPEHPTDQD